MNTKFFGLSCFRSKSTLIFKAFYLTFSNDNDDEFVSESYQASTSDVDEANEAMKKLGVVGKLKFHRKKLFLHGQNKTEMPIQIWKINSNGIIFFLLIH